MAIKIAAKLPAKDDRNGFAGTERVKDAVRVYDEGRGEKVVAVVVFDVVGVNREGGDVHPKLSIVAIEPVMDPAEHDLVTDVLTRLFEARTGSTALDIDFTTKTTTVGGDE